MNNQSSLVVKRGTRLALLLLLAALLLSGGLASLAAPAGQQAAGWATVKLPAGAQTVRLQARAGHEAARHPGLDSALAQVAAAAGRSPAALRDSVEAQSLRLAGGRVQVQLLVDPAAVAEARRVVQAAGGTVTGVGREGALLQGWLPPASLASVAAAESVYLIRQPAAPVLLEPGTAAATTEGLLAMNAAAWHSAGERGAGVKVAVVDGGFDGYPELLGSELPAAVTAKNFVDGETDGQVDGTTPHGTACAEIMHDIAPDAELFLVKIGTDLDLYEAVTWLRESAQVDIISTSVGWYNLTPGDGSGAFADLVQEARDAGIFWVTAAGNDRVAHWGGLYDDPDPAPPDSHYFNASQNINYFGPGDGNAFLVPPGYLIRVFLRWDDWTAVDQDYDLHLLRYTGGEWIEVANSQNSQTGAPGQTPTEQLGYLNTTLAPYGFAISRVNSTRNVNLEVFAPKLARLDEVVYARSLSNLGDAPAAMTVAALDVNAPYPQEEYSSEGPTNGPGGALLGGFVKPDIAAYANVSTDSYGPELFNGTSSATPHVAGAAALLLGANPTYSPDQLQSYLEGHARDMGAAGPDSVYGYGRLYLGDPGGAPPMQVTAVQPDNGRNSGPTSITISGLAFAGGATVRLTRPGEADILATNVTVPVSTTISADLELSGATPGLWDLVVTNPDSETAELPNGFEVIAAEYYLHLPLVRRAPE